MRLTATVYHTVNDFGHIGHTRVVEKNTLLKIRLYPGNSGVCQNCSDETRENGKFLFVRGNEGVVVGGKERLVHADYSKANYSNIEMNARIFKPEIVSAAVSEPSCIYACCTYIIIFGCGRGTAATRTRSRRGVVAVQAAAVL